FLKVTDLPFDLQDFVDFPFVMNLPGAHEPNVKRGELRMLKPRAHKEVPPAKPRGADTCRSFGHEAGHLIGQGPRYAFVCIQKQNPIVSEFKRMDAGVFLRCVIVEPALLDLCPEMGCDFDGSVGAERIKDVDLIRPGNRLETSWQIQLFVLGEDKY